MKIHNVQVSSEPDHYINPQTGRIELRSVSHLAPTGTDQIVWPNRGGEPDIYLGDDDGSFDVPVHVGEAYTKRPGWYVGENPFSEQLLEAAKNKPKPRSKVVVKGDATADADAAI